MANKKLPEPYDVKFMRKKIHQMEGFISEQMKLPKSERLVERVAQSRIDCTTYRRWIRERMEIEPVVEQERDAVRMRRLLDEANYDIMMKDNGFEKLMVSPGVYKYVNIKEAIDLLGTVSFGGFTEQVPVGKRNTISYADMMEAIKNMPRSKHPLNKYTFTIDALGIKTPVLPPEVTKMETRIDDNGVHQDITIEVNNKEEAYDIIRRLTEEGMEQDADKLGTNYSFAGTEEEAKLMAKELRTKAAQHAYQVASSRLAQLATIAMKMGTKLQHVIGQMAIAGASFDSFAKEVTEFLLITKQASYCTDPGDKMDPIIQFHL